MEKYYSINIVIAIILCQVYLSVSLDTCNFGATNETLNQCQVSQWLNWTCENCTIAAMYNQLAVRGRGICCPTRLKTDIPACLAHCNITKNDVSEHGECKSSCAHKYTTTTAPYTCNFAITNETLNQCQVSRWLDWNCDNCTAAAMLDYLAVRGRGICCPSNLRTDIPACLAHCNTTANDVGEHGECKTVCAHKYTTTMAPTTPTTTTVKPSPTAVSTFTSKYKKSKY